MRSGIGAGIRPIVAGFEDVVDIIRTLLPPRGSARATEMICNSSGRTAAARHR